MRKTRFFLYFAFLTFLSLFGHTVWSEPAPANTPAEGQTRPGTNDSFAAVLGYASPASAVPSSSTAHDSVHAVPPLQNPSSEGNLAGALWDVTQTAGTVAKSVTNSVTNSVANSIGDYMKQKQSQIQQEELVRKFYVNLDYVLNNLRLAPPDRGELTERIKQVYIDDAESGRRQLDSLHFQQLPYVARKEYAEMLLMRTRDGEMDTYYLNGARQTHWVIKNGQPDGAIVTYYEDGEILYIDIFKEGRKIRRSKYDPEGKLAFQQDYHYDLADLSEDKKEIPAPAKSLPAQGEAGNAGKKTLDPAGLETVLWPGNSKSSRVAPPVVPDENPKRL